MTKALVPEQPWDRLAGESTKAYFAFCTYRNMGVMNRSMDKVAAELGRNRSWIHEWAKKYAWVARVDEYDAYLERQSRLALEQGIRDMNERHGRLATQMLRRVAQRILGDESEHINAIDVNKLTANDVARLAEVAAKIERLAMGADEPRKEANDAIKLTVSFDTQPVFPGADELHPDVELPPGAVKELPPAPSGGLIDPPA